MKNRVEETQILSKEKTEEWESNKSKNGIEQYYLRKIYPLKFLLIHISHFLSYIYQPLRTSRMRHNVNSK